MADALRLYLRYISLSMRAQMQYRAATVMSAVGLFVNIGTEFLALWALFDRFGQIRGWRLSEVALLYGMVNMSFALAEAVGRGFDTFDRMVKSGEFDRLLLRPRSTVLQLFGQELQIMRIGRFAQGAAVLVWAWGALEVGWTFGSALLLVAAIVGGALLFCGVFVLQATLTFWTTESLEVVNTVSYGGVETSQYPISVYRKWFRRFFIFVVPLACANYFPATAILGHADPMGYPSALGWAAPLVGAAFFGLSLCVWPLGVRKYHSTGS
jgi:ABC-2 type transport system permease protein